MGIGGYLVLNLYMTLNRKNNITNEIRVLKLVKNIRVLKLVKNEVLHNTSLLTNLRTRIVTFDRSEIQDGRRQPSWF